MNRRYYAVFRGFNPGVYDNWDDAREQVEGFPNASYKGYSSSEEATNAYRGNVAQEDGEDVGRLLAIVSDQHAPVYGQPAYSSHPEIDMDAWAVDAACSGNPGKMEYRGVKVSTGEEIFKMGPYQKGTNNIGEFLAIVHAMALMTKKGEFHNIYSDSKTGMAWVRNKKVNTQLKPVPENARLFEHMARAIVWLQTHGFPNRVMKWETDKWGEIPADFGRKR